jgi:hypothetical protein
VAEVVRDEDDLRVLLEAQRLAQLLLVRAPVLDLRVGGVTLDHEVHGLLEQRHLGQVQVRQVTQPAPVVFAPADALLLQAVHARLAHRDSDRPILSAIYADNDRNIRHL